MANINELNLRDEKFDMDFDAVPVGLGSVILPPQPGIYQFRLPAESAIRNCFNVTEDPKLGQIISAILRDDAALWNVTLDEPYNIRISNAIRFLPRRDDPGAPVAISDFAMLLKAVDSPPSINTNSAFAEALIKAYGRTFHAKHVLTGRCDSKRNVFFDGQERQGVKGCGQRYSSEPYTPKKGEAVWEIPKEGGKYTLRFRCGKCNRAEIRSWGQLQGFRR